MSTTFIVSDESVNSYGNIIKTAGIDCKRFSKNPIMFYMHDREKGVIGRWENIRIDGTRLIADAVFDDSTELGKQVKSQVEKGFLRSASIGVEILKKETVKQTEIITSCILTEISIVDIPSNENAVKLFRRFTQKGREFLTLSAKPILSENSDLRGALVEILDLSREATEEDIIKAVISLLDGEERENLQRVEQAINSGLISERERRDYMTMARLSPNIFESILDKEKERRNRAVDTVLANAIKERKIIYAQRDIFKRIAARVSMEDFAELVSCIPPTMKISDYISHSGWTLDEYRRYDPKALEKNPELYEMLLKTDNVPEFKKGSLEYYRHYDPEYLKEHPEEYERMVKEIH